MRVLALIGHYLPATRSGGQLQTMRSLVEQAPSHLEFWIVTRDRDHTSIEAYPGIPTDRWCPVGPARVWYLTPSTESVTTMARLAREASPDVVLANGVFSPLTRRYLLARRLGLAPRDPLVIAPRGELSPGALRIREGRKRLFLATARRTGLLVGATWQASTDQERSEILAALAGLEPDAVGVALDPGIAPPPGPPRPSAKRPGSLRLVYVSRITPKKNLEAALRALAGVRGDVSFDVHGTVDDENYWLACKSAMARLPEGVTVRHHGALDPDRVLETFAAHDFSVLPTLGENFGHVILESLLAGCPVLLSDRTPWPDLGFAGAGFTLPPGDLAGWTRAFQACVDMGQEEHGRMMSRAPEVARAFTAAGDAMGKTVALLAGAVRRGSLLNG